MPELDFNIEGVEVVPFAAAPLLAFKTQINSDRSDVAIHSVLLRCQIRIEATRRRYLDEEQAKLFELFGAPDQWGRSLRALLWAQTHYSVPGFTGSTMADLPVPCTYDFDVAASKYFDALAGGDVPLCFLFSGTVFYATDSQPLQVAQISWEKEARFPLPVAVWRDVMERYYPNSRWLRVRKDLFDRLAEYKSRSALPSWDNLFEEVLEQMDAGREAASVAADRRGPQPERVTP